jgi:tyrosyl-tRNA synthetase
VSQFEITKSEIAKKLNVVDFLTGAAHIFPSKGEARRMLKEGGVAINKEKVTEDFEIDESLLLNNKYLLVQKGKKNYYLVKVV